MSEAGLGHEPHQIPIRHEVIRKMAASWPKRATLRSELYSFEGNSAHDPARPDYPIELVPFREHPRFLAATPEQQRDVLTWAWIVYNDRTIAVEEYVANPAFTLIMHDTFPGATDIHLKKSIQQCLIDEHFHTFMHMAANHETRQLRGLTGELNAPPPITQRRLEENLAEAKEPWERALLSLGFGVVAEISVKHLLNLLATNEVIQPAHKLLPALHNRDEYAHGELLTEVTKVLWCHMNEKQKRFFIQVLPKAVDAFIAQDFSAWRAIVDKVKIEGADEIIGDVERDASKGRMLRDVSGVERMARDIGILEQLEYTFPRAS